MPHIILDIGHAANTGARGNGAEEHAVAAAFAEALQRMPQLRGVQITVLDFPTLTNRGDLAATIAAANKTPGVLFGVSLHLDSAENPAAHGAHICYKTARGRALAGAIAPHLTAIMPGRAAAIVNRQDLGVLNQTRAPWVLIELGFITHAADLAKIRDNPATAADERLPLLHAVANGINAAIRTAEHGYK